MITEQPTRTDAEVSPRTRTLLITFRRALLMMASAIADYLGLEDKH